jgi:hypothetical protein
MTKDSTWGDGTMIAAAVRLYNCSIKIVQKDGKPIELNIPSNNDFACSKKSIFIGFIDTPDEKGNHYVSLVPMAPSAKMAIVNDHISFALMEKQDKISPAIAEADSNNCNNELDCSMSTLNTNINGDKRESNIACLDSPFHPDVRSIQEQYVSEGKRKLSFQQHWFRRFPWLHFSPETTGVLCFYCAKAEALHLLDLSNKREAAYTTVGFLNWKKALDSFEKHSKSRSHIFCMHQLAQITSASPVDHLIIKQTAEKQLEARNCLLLIFTTVKYLARQGIAFRGHDDNEGQ